MPLPWLRRFYASEYLVKPSSRKGELPSTRAVYQTSLRVAGPSIIEYFLISLITMADTIMVSSVGPHAIAAVGITLQPKFIVQGMVLALNVGVTTMTARRYGENNHDGAVSCLKQSLVLCLGISTVLSLLAHFFGRELLLFAGAQPDTIDAAQAYFNVIMLALPINSLSLTISAALRGIGHTRAPMIINMSANLVNVFFNYLLIGGRLGFPALGVRGAAIATAIGWTVGLGLALVPILRRNQYFFLLERIGWKFESTTLRSLYKVSSGAFVEQICVRIGFFTYNKIVAGLGTIMYATHQIGINILSLSFSVGEGLSLAAASLVGQNLGAKRPDLSVLYAKSLQRMSLVYCSALVLFFMGFGRELISLFSHEPEILDTGGKILLIAGVVCLGQASQMIYMGSLRGAGDTMYIAVVSMVSIMLIRPLLAYTLAYTLGFGLLGAWCSFLLDQLTRLVTTYHRFSSGRWASIKL